MINDIMQHSQEEVSPLELTTSVLERTDDVSDELRQFIPEPSPRPVLTNITNTFNFVPHLPIKSMISEKLSHSATMKSGLSGPSISIKLRKTESKR